MTKSLRIQRDAVALEAFSASDVSEYFNGIFPTISASFQGFVSRITPTDAGLLLSPSYRDFLREIPKHSYLDIAPITAFVPEGMNVPYLEYADTLLSAVEHASKIMDVLNPYSVYLSQLISNREMKFSTASTEIEYKILEKERDVLNYDLAGCFKKGSSATDLAISAVVKRNSDWDDVFSRCEAITKKINTVDRKAVLKKIQECADHLSVIRKMIDRKEMESVANQTVMNLANGAFQVASELEFYSLCYFRSEVFVACVNKTLQHFKKVMDTQKAPK